jgi:hypothetical protein
MVNVSGANGHYNGTRKQASIIYMPEVHLSEIFPGPPDDVLELALHDYARRSLSLAQRLDYLLKDFGYKIRYNVLINTFV